MLLFSSNLKKLRVSKNLTQKQMAEILGIVDRQYQRYEAGQVDPPLSNVIKLADLFNVSLDYLVGRSDYESFKISPEYQRKCSDETINQEIKK